MSNSLDAFASAISSQVFGLLTFQGNLSHQNPMSVCALKVTELVAEFSPSAYMTDTHLSRLKRIPFFIMAVRAV